MGKDINKGMYPAVIYKYIRENSDEEKYITIPELIEHMKEYSAGNKDSSIKRTVERNIAEIVRFDEDVHIVLKGEDQDYQPYNNQEKDIVGIYYDQPFSNNDIRFLTDAVVYSKHMKQSDKITLIDEIATLRPSHSNAWYKNALSDSAELMQTESELFRNLDFINQAIAEKRCLKFDRMLYGADWKLHIRKKETGFSPYNIYIDNDTYYVIGVTKTSRTMKEHFDAFFATHHREMKRDYAIARFEVFKMRKLAFDDDNSYLNISKTTLKNKTLRDVCAGEYNIYHILEKPGAKVSENVKFSSNLRGLQAIIAAFGRRAMIKKASVDSLPDGVAERYPDDEYFSITLKKVGRNNWTTIVSLLTRYPISDIALLSHHEELNRIISQLDKHTKLKAK